MSGSAPRSGTSTTTRPAASRSGRAWTLETPAASTADRDATDTSDGDGRTEFTYESKQDPDSNDESVTVTVEFDRDGDGTFGETDAEVATFEITVVDTTGSGGGEWWE